MLWWESQQEDVICIESTRLVFWPNTYLATSSSTSVVILVQDVSKFGFDLFTPFIPLFSSCHLL